VTRGAFFNLVCYNRFTAHGSCHDAKAVVGLAGDGGGEPESFGCGLALEFLEHAAQPRTVGRCGYGEAVALVIRAGFGAELVPGNGGVGLGSGQVAGRQQGGETREYSGFHELPLIALVLDLRETGLSAFSFR
jgi:hypothetical protein